MTAYSEFRDWIHALSETELRPYIEQLRLTGLPDDKEINDPIWGTIVVRSVEVAVLDSPLMQRLRDIRQLGVVHQVYPSANHTRFEHSLGAFHALATLTSVISELRGAAPAVPEELAPVMRLAALVHDIGHPVMSHVSEKALDLTDWANDLRLEASEIYDPVDEHSLSEIAALEMIGSPAFGDLMSLICERSRGLGGPQDIIANIQKCIISTPIHDEYPFLCDLISGPFDADKLDYITRDTRLCGLPTVLDTNRLLRKLRSERISRSDLPRRLVDTVLGDLDSYVAIAVAKSGVGTLDELALARALLHSKVYRHHKTRAFESMIGGMVRILVDLRPDAALWMWDQGDSDFISLSLRHQFERRGLDVDAEVDLVAVTYDGLRAAFRNRDDAVAAYAWTLDASMFGSLLRDRQLQAVNGLSQANRDHENRRDLLDELVQEFWRAFDLLQPADQPSIDLADRSHLQYLVGIDFGRTIDRRAVLENAYLLDRDRHLIPFLEATTDSDALGSYYINNREVSYAFAPRSVAPLVTIVCEVVLWQRFGVRTTTDMLQERHVSEQLCEGLREKLRIAGYFDDKVPELGPAPRSVASAAGRNRVDALVKRWSNYEPPLLEVGDGERTTVTHEDIRHFVRQFRDPAHAGACLDMLERVIVMGREVLRTQLEPIVIECNGLWRVAPLGGPSESSAHVGYAMKDVLSARHGLTLTSIEELTDTDDGILFLDDFIGSGSRLLGCVSGWLDVELPGASHTRPPEVSEHVKRLFREKPVVFGFAANHSEGAERAQATLREVVNPQISVRAGELIVPLAASDGVPADFIDELTRIGRELMRNAGCTDEEADDRALGRGNWGMLLTTTLNTPAQTVTALWKRGEVDGHPWEPLFPRVL